jgi:glycerol-3-phosphate dehydrogenase (NAD(P)+)
MMTKLEVAVLGAGRLADVLVAMLEASEGVRFKLWARRDEARARMTERHPKLETSGDIGAVTAKADLVFFAVPAGALEAVTDAYGPFARGDQIVAHASRGAREGFRLPHQLIRSKSCVKKIVAIGGPLHGRELGSGRVLAAAVASRFDEGIQALRTLVAGTPIRLHPSKDVIGVEVAGAISNVTALAAGMCDALELGETAKGLLLTRGLAEAQRLGVALGADPATFIGLAGVGDLVPRKVSSTERHHQLGSQVAKEKPLAQALAESGGEVEGIVTARAAVERGSKLKLKLPLIETVDGILRGEVAPRTALEAILRLDLDDLVPGARATREL